MAVKGHIIMSEIIVVSYEMSMKAAVALHVAVSDLPEIVIHTCITWSRNFGQTYRNFFGKNVCV